MSKEVDSNKSNINQELLKCQVADSVSLFISLILVYLAAKLISNIGYEYIGVLAIAFVTVVAIQEYGRNNLKKILNESIIKIFNQTSEEINSIQEKNRFQKENNYISTDKIKTTQELLAGLKTCSQDMKDLTSQIQKQTDSSLDFTNGEYNSVKTNIEKMFSIRHKIQTIAELILELSDFVQSISSTIGLVEDIAEQTNLLALNAAVEAARAGEHGKGFAVVASEIRKLADESKQATAKIISLVNDIQQTANSTVLATEEGTKEIESGLSN